MRVRKGAEELLAEIKKFGGTIEPMVKFCQFQVFGQGFQDFCIQPLESPYRVNLGLAGGPAVCCEGAPRLRRVRKAEIGSREILEPEYEQVEPCPFKANGKILGWKITLPAAGPEEPEVENG